MAITNTDLQTLQMEFPDILDHDLRDKNFGFTQSAMMRGADELKPLIQGKRSLIRTTQYAFLDDDGVATNGGRYLINIADAPANSRIVTVNWYTIQANTTLIPAHNEGNTITISKQNAKNIRAVTVELKKQLETIIATNVMANRSVVASPGITYPFVGNKYQVPNLDKTSVLNTISGIIQENSFNSSDIDIFVNPMYSTEVHGLMEHSKYNDANELLRINGKNIYYSEAISLAAGVQYEMITGIEGSFLVGNWNEIDATKGHVAQNGMKSTVDLPNFPLTLGLYEQHAFIDGTGTVGPTATKRDNYSFATEVCVITELQTDPNAVRGVNSFEILT